MYGTSQATLHKGFPPIYISVQPFSLVFFILLQGLGINKVQYFYNMIGTYTFIMKVCLIQLHITRSHIYRAREVKGTVQRN